MDRIVYKAVQLLVGIGLAILMVIQLFDSNASFENLALGTQTSTYQAKNAEGKLVHFLHLDSSEIVSLEQALFQEKESITLILGNSQTHSINQFQSGEVNYVELLQKKLGRSNSLYCLSFPNANLLEFYATFDFVASKAKIKRVILPVFMDDLREEGIREAFFSQLYNARHQSISGDNSAKLINLIFSEKEENTNLEKKGVQTTQERAENWLNEELNKRTSFWQKRENIRGNLFNWLYMLRNTAFGIRPGSVRKMIPSAYKQNLQALNDLIQRCHKVNIEVILYVPPIRSDIPMPYDINEYKQFLTDLDQMRRKHQLPVIPNYTKIIPGKYWGYKEATNFIDNKEIDFMHFQFAGHRILADSLLALINK